MKPEYELTWHFECSGDEAAEKIYQTVKASLEATAEYFPGGHKFTVRLTKVMEGHA